MDVRIRPVRETDCADVVRLSLRAWEPVFRSFQNVLGSQLYVRMWPDWTASQSESITAICRGDGKTVTLVAELSGIVIGFIAYVLDEESRTGEVTYLAVDPAHQNRGVGTELNRFVLRRMKEAGMEMARVETGGDPGHAPARAAYERAGYVGLPCVRYYQILR